ncbi:MAG: DUF3598 family protein [Synechocystis sp.]
MENWQNFLKNLGEWRGSFTRLTPQGVEVSSTPSILTLEGLEENRLVRFRLRRYDNPDYHDPPSQDYSQDYRSLGRQAIFFNTGAFCKGPWQLAPFTEFGAEFGFVDGDRRFRFVQLYDKELSLSSLTLIREFRQGSAAQERPPLSLEQLLGTWRGQACTAYPDWRDPEISATALTLTQNGTYLQQTLTMGNQTIHRQGVIEDKQIRWAEANPRTLLLLPDGGSSDAPDRLQLRQPFSVEVGWLVRENERQRLIRHYDEKGAWAAATFISEHRV